MAIHPLYNASTSPVATVDSDYGSDIDDATADALLSQAESQSPLKEPLQNVLENQPAIAELEEDVYTHNFSVRLARLQQSPHGVEESRATMEAVVQSRRRREAAIEVEYDERNREAFSPSNPEEPAQSPRPPEPQQPLKKDHRSPLQRFRARRPLSVTNLISPSWCEQQYEYNLGNYGRIPKTKAMSAGSSLHKELEEQVHVEVPVEVVSREDRMGLRLWNTIQGLRALRTTGLTRELEVWGWVEGEVVNGIIDEVTAECPDVEMEGRMLRQQGNGGDGENGGKGKKEPQLAPDQRTLTDFFTSPSRGGSTLESQSSSFLEAIHKSSEPSKEKIATTTYYLKDIKTTSRPRPPTQPAYTRAAHLQLMLYHRILSSLTANEVPAQKVFARYGLNAEADFSDKFIAELANLDVRAYASVPDEVVEDERDLPLSQRKGERDPLTELLERKNLALLWGLLVEELQRTFVSPPPKADNTGASKVMTNANPSISALLTVEYRSPLSAHDQLIGTLSFPLSRPQLDAYVKDEISWWRGERGTVGVSVDEAWKCGWCEFREGCTWRKTKVEEGLERVRMRREGTVRSEV